jgi:hypothetical protein
VTTPTSDPTCPNCGQLAKSHSKYAPEDCDCPRFEVDILRSALTAAQQEIARLKESNRIGNELLGIAAGQLDDHKANLASLHASRDALAQDAARYRYIRNAVPESRFELTGEKVPITPEQYDRMIDAAMAASPTGEPNDAPRQ